MKKTMMGMVVGILAFALGSTTTFAIYDPANTTELQEGEVQILRSIEPTDVLKENGDVSGQSKSVEAPVDMEANVETKTDEVVSPDVSENVMPISTTISVDAPEENNTNWVLGIVFTSILSFGIGLLAGRKTFLSKHSTK